MSVEDVLKELEGVGALGQPKEPVRKSIEEVELEEGAPSPRLVDVRGPRMVSELTRLKKNLTRISEAASDAAEAAERLVSIWTTVDAAAPRVRASEEEEGIPGHVAPAQAFEGLSDEEEEEAAMNRALARMADQQEKQIQQLLPDDAIRAREAARAKIRGEHLDQKELAAVHGGSIPEGPVVISPDVGVPDLTPSVPKES